MKKLKKNKSNFKIKIISGSWKGKSISFPNKQDLRPTKNQIRETLFNWLQNEVEHSICLDLFAGSGALGFEAMSRGAKKVYMVDNDIDVINCLKIQVELLNAENILLYNLSAENFIQYLKEKIDIIFLDPPFSKNLINSTLSILHKMDNLRDKCKIYIELPFSKNVEKSICIPDNWELLRIKKTGDVSYLLFQYNQPMI